MKRVGAFGLPTIVACLSAAVVVSVGGWQILRTRDGMLRAAEQNVSSLARSLAQHAARTVEAADLTLLDAVERVGGHTGVSGLPTHLARRDALLRQARNFVVVDAGGRRIAESAPAHRALSFAGRDDFRWHQAHAGPGLRIGAMLVGPQTGLRGIPISRRIDRPDGSFAGVAAALLAPEYYEEFYRGLQVGRRSAVGLWLESGQMLVRYPVLADTSGVEVAAPLPAAAALFRQTSGVARFHSPLDGVERLVAFERVDGLPLVASAAVAVEDVLADWHREALVEAVVVGLAAVVLICLGLGLEWHRRRFKALDAASRESDRQYRLLADNSHDLIVLKPGFEDRRSYVSPSSRNVLGWEPDELAELAVATLIHPDDLAVARADFAALTASSPIGTNRARFRHKAGRYVWLETLMRRTEDGRVLLSSRDVTARHEAERALAESEGRYRIMAETTSDVITQLDLSMRRQYISPACLHVLGYEARELLGRRPSDMVHPDDVGDLRALAARLVRGEVAGDRTSATYRTRHKDGRWIWVEAGMNLVRDGASGAPVSLICSLRDVTERQRLARHMQRARDVAEEAARVKSDFVANMSHELRTPLTGILGVHDLLKRDASLTAPQRRLVDLASEAGTSLLAIVNDVLDLSKIEAGRLTLERVPFDVEEVLDGCRRLAARGIKEKPIELLCRLDPGMPRHMLGDPTRLRQILLNLLTNAVKFTEAGEIVAVATYRTHPAMLRLDVTDTGIGVPADRIALLFERFTQGDTSMSRKYGGTGLGLAISKRLATLMGGQIGLLPAERGAHFWVEIPLVGLDHGPPSDRPAKTLPGERGRGRHLLLVEDNPLNTEIIATALRAQRFRVTCVGNGAVALDAVVARHGFDLVLMDLQMPVMDGIAATLAIRAHEGSREGRRLPIIGLTANALPEDAARCLAAGMDDHVAKPIVWPTLFAALERHLEGGAAGASGPEDGQATDPRRGGMTRLAAPGRRH